MRKLPKNVPVVFIEQTVYKYASNLEPALSKAGALWDKEGIDGDFSTARG